MVLPIVNGNANYTYLTPVAQATLPTPDGPRELQFIPHNNLNFNLSAGYTLYDFGRAKKTIYQIGGAAVIQQHALYLTKHNLAYQIAQLYYSISFLGQSIKVQNDVIF